MISKEKTRLIGKKYKRLKDFENDIKINNKI